MARMPRLVIPGYPHHVIQRGTRRMRTFFSTDDYQYYLDLVARYKADAGITVWAYCLMPNHVHFVVVPQKEDSLARLFRQVHLRYTRTVNLKQECKGHLWQERFHSFAMNEHYLLAAVRYVELNPVKAKLCINPEAWRWSSAGAHLEGRNDEVVTTAPMLRRINNWREYLSSSDCDDESIRRHSSSGRPAGDETFIQTLEDLTGRYLRNKKRGPKPKIK